MIKIEKSQDERILDVYYRHVTFTNRDEMYITSDGLPYMQQILPENHIMDNKWFTANNEKQQGTSIIFKVKTKPVSGESIDIIIKWNRMGEDIPGESAESGTLTDARFLSPFEEFQYLYELKEGLKYTGKNIELQKPLAIYTPSAKKSYLKSSRRKYLMDFIKKSHKTDVEIDIERSYIVIYKWIEGIDAVQAQKRGYIDENKAVALTLEANSKMKNSGFIVRDNKALHIIVKPNGGNSLRDEDTKNLFGYVDYELLERTPENTEIIKRKRRNEYLNKMTKRFIEHGITSRNLKSVRIFDVPYIFGEVPSSKGRLWVVGKDASLFDFFLPEKWRKMDRTKLSEYHNIYHKVTKDNINIVLKTSKVGEQPDIDPFEEHCRKILEYGFNSPFEEVSLAIELSQKGIQTIYPRAIYMTGSKSKIPDQFFDSSRYKSHKKLVLPDKKECILIRDHRYIVIWGYWNGPDEMLADYDGNYYKAINALRAYRNSLINKKTYFKLMEIVKGKLHTVGIEDLNYRGTHILLSLNDSNKIIKSKEGVPEMRICNFELLRRIIY